MSSFSSDATLSINQLARLRERAHIITAQWCHFSELCSLGKYIYCVTNQSILGGFNVVNGLRVADFIEKEPMWQRKSDRIVVRIDFPSIAGVATVI